VKLGRRDARSASRSAANNGIPPPTSNLNQLISRFGALGLSTKDLVALSGILYYSLLIISHVTRHDTILKNKSFRVCLFLLLRLFVKKKKSKHIF
jgi:hypothetical protein